MKYCRYCSFCILGDCYYCTEKNEVLKTVNKPVNCDEYVESELGDVETGKRYKPRENAVKVPQVNMFGGESNESTQV